MTIRTDTYAATRPVPYLLERSVVQTIACPVRHGADGSLVTPGSGTITITRPDGTDLVSGAAVTVASSTATYDVTPAASETLGQGWTVEWTLVFSGVTYPVYRFEAFLCEYVPPCPISVLDLFGREPEMRHRIPQDQGDRGDNTGWQPQIDEVYYELIQGLIDDSSRLWLIRGMTGAREWFRARTLELCCRILSTSPDSVWARKATDYMYEARNSRARLVFQYTTDTPDIRRGASPVTRLSPIDRPIL